MFSNLFNIERTISFLTRDEWCRKKSLALYIFTFGSLFGLLTLLIFIIGGSPPKEGFTEKLSELFYLISVALLLLVTFGKKRVPLSSPQKRKISWYAISVAIILLVIFGEEISWGQHLFEWNSSDFFLENNYQKETNIHNFFNPLFDYIYPVAGISIFLFLNLGWYFSKSNNTALFHLFFPHSSLYLLSTFITVSSFSGYNELFEILFATFALLYSFRILMCIRNPSQKAFIRNK